MREEAEFQRRTGQLLSRAGELKHRRMHEFLDELGLYSGQSSVLRFLWAQDGLTQTELAECLHRSPSTITKTVQRLEKAGYVQRGPDDSDERISRVFLTDAGRTIRPAVEAIWDRLDNQLFAGFATDELALFCDFLARVSRNIERKP
jgi:DNA-binding MarR family transcriptional regulator